MLEQALAQVLRILEDIVVVQRVLAQAASALVQMVVVHNQVPEMRFVVELEEVAAPFEELQHELQSSRQALFWLVGLMLSRACGLNHGQTCDLD